VVRRSLTAPADTIAANVLGTTHLLESLLEAPDLKAVLIITSDKVYAHGPDTRAPFREDARLGGCDPYSASKAAKELIAAAFAASYYDRRGIALATARAGNVLGGGDYAADRLVPDIIRAASSGERLVLRHPEATRPWQHVLDCLAGYFIFVETMAGGGDFPRALNFGPSGAPPTVATLAEAMLAAIGLPSAWDHRPEPGSVEMTALAVDSTAARRSLGWRDRLQGPALIRWTADWYRAVAAGQDARAITLAQIASYEQLSREAV
jgi:CDP-glucose 4,6-dehydratase